jgi:hypothetical protein
MSGQGTNQILNVMKLIECGTLVNIEGEVYKLSQNDYDNFKKKVYDSHCDSHNDDWSEILHWVQSVGKLICYVESYNF